MSDERLMRAMAAAAPPARDPAFVLAVLERAEKARWRRDRLHAVLRGLGLGVATVALVPALAGAVGGQVEALQNGTVGAFALLTLVATAGMLSRRVPAR